MFGIHDFWLFLISGVLLNLAPGQDTFYILGRSIAGGTRTGMISVLGISTGSVVHTIAAALGLSTLLAASATAFMLVKFAGAAYLIYLGARMLLAEPTAGGSAPNVSNETSSSWRSCRNPSVRTMVDRCVGGLFVVLGIRLAVTR